MKTPGKTPVENIIKRAPPYEFGGSYQQDSTPCPSIASHVANCPVCSNLRFKEQLLYVLTGAGIVAVLVFLNRVIFTEK